MGYSRIFVYHKPTIFFSESLWGWELKTDSSILTFEFEINDYLPEFYSRVFEIDGPK